MNTITLNPGRTRSLLHFVVLGQRVNAANSGDVRAAVETTATSLAAAPPISDLTAPEVCSIDNFDIAALTANGFNYSHCKGANLFVAQPPVPQEPPAKTNVRYNVVGKTIGQLRAAMESGVVTSVEITQAYLDRIKAYDQGQFGFNAFEVLSNDALEQARAADYARGSGVQSPLLGIPIGIKEPLRHVRPADHERQLDVRGLPSRARRLPGRAAA